MQATSRHFHLEPLTEGVYAAIARDGGAAGSNAGIIDLGDRCLLFDMLLTPQAAVLINGMSGGRATLPAT